MKKNNIKIIIMEFKLIDTKKINCYFNKIYYDNNKLFLILPEMKVDSCEKYYDKYELKLIVDNEEFEKFIEKLDYIYCYYSNFLSKYKSHLIQENDNKYFLVKSDKIIDKDKIKCEIDISKLYIYSSKGQIYTTSSCDLLRLL